MITILSNNDANEKVRENPLKGIKRCTHLGIIRTHTKLSANHIDTDASAEPTAKCFPVGSKSIQIHVPACPLAMCNKFSCGYLQNQITHCKIMYELYPITRMVY